MPVINCGYCADFQKKEILYSTNFVADTYRLPERKESDKKQEKEKKEVELAYEDLKPRLRKPDLFQLTQALQTQDNYVSPFLSTKSFKDFNLSHDLLKGISAMGFDKPSRIQEVTLNKLKKCSTSNMIMQSQSGTGKTLAFILAALSGFSTFQGHPQVLIVTPSTELAVQAYEVATKVAEFCPYIRFRLARHGKKPPGGQRLNEPVVIGSLKTINYWTNYFDCNKVHVCIFDEADEMISTHVHDSNRLLKKLSSNCQKLFFSATYSESQIVTCAKYFIRSSVLKLQKEDECLPKVRQYFIFCVKRREKMEALRNIYDTLSTGQVIIFCNLRETAFRLAGSMFKGKEVAVLSEDMKFQKRKDIYNRFFKGEEMLLITTNAFSRGVDFPKTTIVINYDLPVFLNGQADCEGYLHRIGRAGRFGKPGLAISMVDGHKSMVIARQIEKHFERTLVEIHETDQDDLWRVLNME